MVERYEEESRRVQEELRVVQEELEEYKSEEGRRSEMLKMKES